MESCNSKSIKTLSGYVSIIEQILPEKVSDLFIDQHIFFRGHSNKNYQIIPSLGRYVDEQCEYPLQLTLFERDLIHRAQSEFPNQFPTDLFPLMLLSKLQHFGIPTRLLDITMNAYVALFFACRNNDSDGEVIVFQTDTLEMGLDSFINALADTYRIHAGVNDMSYSHFVDQACKQSYYSSHYSLVDHNIDDQEIKKLPFEKVARSFFRPRFVLPQQLSERQKIQRSLFILFPNAPMDWTDPPGIGDKIEPIEKSSDLVKMRILIPKEIKRKLLVDLALFGIEESLLFPEDIDKGCSYIVREYKERLKRTEHGGHNAVE